MDDTGLPNPILNPAPPPPQVPVENPQIQKPVNQTVRGLKKLAPKLLAGAFVVALLVGGALLGVNQVQKKQIVEQQASQQGNCNLANDKTTCESCGWAWETNVGCCPPDKIACSKVGEIQCTAKPKVQECTEYSRFCSNPNYWRTIRTYNTVEEICEDKDCKEEDFCTKPPGCPPFGTDPICLDPPQYYCFNLRTCVAGGKTIPQCIESQWPNKKVPVTEYSSCDQNSIPFKKCSCNTASPSPSASANPSPSASASPSPSASVAPILKCVDLTKNNASPKLNDVVTFVCKANLRKITNPKAYFRHSTDGGVTFSAPAPAAGKPIDLDTKRAAYNITINKPGDWEVQCRVCGQVNDGALSLCTTWGRANVPTSGGID